MKVNSRSNESNRRKTSAGNWLSPPLPPSARLPPLPWYCRSAGDCHIGDIYSSASIPRKKGLMGLSAIKIEIMKECLCNACECTFYKLNRCCEITCELTWWVANRIRYAEWLLGGKRGGEWVISPDYWLSPLLFFFPRDKNALSDAWRIVWRDTVIRAL